MNTGQLTVVTVSMSPLPVPLWVEGLDVRGVAIAIKHTHLTPTYPDWNKDGDSHTYEWIVMGDTGDVEEVNTDKTSVVRPHYGDPYAAYLEGRNR